MDLVSSFVMLVTSRLAARPSIYKYPVVSCLSLISGMIRDLTHAQGRTRIETIGVILFCALMTTVAIQLIVGSDRYPTS